MTGATNIPPSGIANLRSATPSVVLQASERVYESTDQALYDSLASGASAPEVSLSVFFTVKIPRPSLVLTAIALSFFPFFHISQVLTPDLIAAVPEGKRLELMQLVCAVCKGSYSKRIQ